MSISQLSEMSSMHRDKSDRHTNLSLDMFQRGIVIWSLKQPGFFHQDDDDRLLLGCDGVKQRRSLIGLLYRKQAKIARVVLFHRSLISIMSLSSDQGYYLSLSRSVTCT